MTITLNGHACVSGHVDIPGVGLWYAHVDLAEKETPRDMWCHGAFVTSDDH